VKRCRFELLQWGGDELLFVVPAWLGLPVLQQFFRQVYTWRDKPLTHSAGMVLCPRKTPIARAQKLAEELTDWCKLHSRKEDLYATLILESIDYPTQRGGEGAGAAARKRAADERGVRRVVQELSRA